jgi:hypothetical protein
LSFLFDTERGLFESLSMQEQAMATDEMLTALDITEEIIDA